MTTIINEWVEQYHSYNRNVKLFIISNIFIQIGMGIFMIIYNFYIRELGYDDQMNGNIISLTSLASAIILIPAGILSDKIGRKKIMVIGVIVSFGILCARSLLEIDSLLMLAAFILGISMSLIQVSSIPWLAENSTHKQRVHLFSFYFAIIMASNVIGNLLGGVLSDTFQYVFHFSSLMSIRFTLMIASIIFLIGLLPLLKCDELMKQKTIKQEKKSILFFISNNKGQLKIIFLFAIAQLLIGFGAGLVIPYLNLYFSDRFQATNSIIGIILSLGQLATAIAMFIGPIVVKRLGEVRAIVALQLLSLPFLLLTGYTHNLLIAAIGFLFRQALMNAGNPIINSLIMNKVDNSVKGLANSVNQMVFQLGWATMGPISTTIVVMYGEYWGYALVFSITACLYFVGSVYFYLTFKEKKIKKHPIVETL